ncbi:unnamed protein product [Macrosiphum euphorbiae]|uniref:Uncharacterized protein n=1 Tax=Macrosiphum euphorbiae TaxID=13131 RepID=A0AAV0XFT6_9HEMI|nr:unnamed protein product [Macrosiphum euphorbiae]
MVCAVELATCVVGGSGGGSEIEVGGMVKGSDSSRRASIISKCTLDGSSTKRFAISSSRANTWHIITGIIAAEQNGPPPPFMLTPHTRDGVTTHHRPPTARLLHRHLTTAKNPNDITSAIIGISDP